MLKEKENKNMADSDENSKFSEVTLWTNVTFGDNKEGQEGKACFLSKSLADVSLHLSFFVFI